MEKFHIVKNEEWRKIAAKTNFTGFLHPYVQIPLWAKVIQPLCTSLPFPAFNSLFILLAALSTAALVFLSLRCLAPSVYNLWGCALLLLWLWCSEPFRYGMVLTQTHPLILLATLGGLLLVERGKQGWGGVLLAIAAAIKITPGLLVIYWLVSRRWKALGWFCGAMFVLAGLSVVTTGLPVNLAFSSEIQRISKILLVAYNNQSLAAVVMAPYYKGEIRDWRILELPVWLKYVSMMLACTLIALASVFRRKGWEEGGCISIALIAMTAFAPIAWSHYYTVLVVPLAWLMHYAVSSRQYCFLLPVALIAFLCISPSVSSVSMHARVYFQAAMSALVICLLLGITYDWRRPKAVTPAGSD